MIALDGTENKSPARRQCHPRRVAGRRQGGGRAPRPAALPLRRRRHAHVLPVPMMNIINGGAHADNPIDIQEFMIMPVGADTVAEALRMGAEIFHTLKKALKDAGPQHQRRRRGRLRAQSQERGRGAGLHRQGRSRRPATSRARTWCWRSTAPRPSSSRTATTSSKARARRSISAGMVDYLGDLVARYPIVSIEDGMAEDDWAGWKLLTEPIGGQRASWSATTCSSPTRAAVARHRGPGSPIRSWSRSTRSAR